MEPSAALDEAKEETGPGGAGPSLRFSAMSVPARIAVATVGGLLALLAAVHMAAVTFWVAPPENVVREQYGGPMRDYLGSEFAQSWSLFAPNPNLSSYDLEVRVEERSGRTTDWINLTDRDEDTQRHSLVPSKSVIIQLRRAVTFYVSSHDQRGNPETASAPVVEGYLRRLVLLRLEDDVDISQAERLQYRLVRHPVEPPPWTDTSGNYAPQYYEHLWRDVRPGDLPGADREVEAAS